MKKLIFISHKYKDNPKKNRKDADRICRYWHRKGFLPISPLHLFSYIDGDEDREAIMEVCKKLILMCDEVAVYHQSSGCKQEENFALQHKKRVHRFYPQYDDEDYEKMMEDARDIIL